MNWQFYSKCMIDRLEIYMKIQKINIFSEKSILTPKHIFLSMGGGGWGGRNTMNSIPIKKEAIQNLEKTSNNVEDKNLYFCQENWYVRREKIDIFV